MSKQQGENSCDHTHLEAKIKDGVTYYKNLYWSESLCLIYFKPFYFFEICIHGFKVEISSYEFV